jgi:threonine synthase
MATHTRYTGLIEHYRDRLPVSDSTRIISLGEGNTPLIELHNIPRLIGKNVKIYIKYEGLNPTGSFKDRGMSMAVTKAVEDGSQAIICASTGNTSAAAAAYAVRAGIRAFVLIPEGKIAQGKLAQTLMYGAEIIQIRGNFDEGMSLVKQVVDHAPVTIVNSINPFRIEGQKTAAFEIVDELGRAPKSLKQVHRKYLHKQRAFFVQRGFFHQQSYQTSRLTLFVHSTLNPKTVDDQCE